MGQGEAGGHLPESLAATVPEAQNPDVGRFRRQIFGCEAQEGAQDHPVQATAGVPLGFHRCEEPLQTGLPPGLPQELPPQALGGPGQGGEGLLLQSPEPGQHRPLPQG